MDTTTQRGIIPNSLIRRGFSVLEIVVVMAILALLTALIVTLSSNAANKVKAVQCSTNLRQIGQVILLYAAENQGNLVPTVWQHEGTTSGTVWIQTLHRAGMFERGTHDNPAWHLNPNGMFTCPSLTGREEGRQKFQAKYPQHREFADYGSYYFDGIHYGMVSVIAGVDNKRTFHQSPLKIGSFANPSTTMIVGETDYRYIIMAGERTFRASPHEGSYYLNLDGSVGFWAGDLPVGSSITPSLPPFWTERS